MKPDGFNIGINLGKVAGAGISDICISTSCPRWIGDTNFMPVLANTIVVPEASRELAANSAPPWPELVADRHALTSDVHANRWPPKPSTSKTPASRSSFSTTTRATSRRSKSTRASKPPPAKAGSSWKARPMPSNAPSTCSCCSRASLKAGTPVRNREFTHALSVVKHEGVSDPQGPHDATASRPPTRSPASPPRPLGQKKYLDAIRQHDVTFGIGPAGTGKTYLAVAMALAALREGKVSRIILTRPAVEAGEALGFLPGDLYEKIMPYLRPLHDALHDMLPAEEIQKHTERGVIEIAPLAYMRGRTLNNAFIILDEAQNSTTEQMFMFLTRLGHGSKAVITGDETQIDLPPHKHSGLLEAHRALRALEGIAIVEFGKRDVVRHPLVQRIIAAYEEHRGRAESRSDLP